MESDRAYRKGVSPDRGLPLGSGIFLFVLRKPLQRLRRVCVGPVVWL